MVASFCIIKINTLTHIWFDIYIHIILYHLDVKPSDTIGNDNGDDNGDGNGDGNCTFGLISLNIYIKYTYNMFLSLNFNFKIFLNIL